MNYTYIVRCKDGTLYTGWTNDLEKRIRAHNEGKGAKYTKGRRPVRLVYYEEFAGKEEAMKRECALKRMARAEKEKLIREKAEFPEKMSLGSPKKEEGASPRQAENEKKASPL